MHPVLPIDWPKSDERPIDFNSTTNHGDPEYMLTDSGPGTPHLNFTYDVQLK